MTIQIPVRESGDYKYTVRQSDWNGGYNRLYFQNNSTPSEPRYWDGFNTSSVTEGEIQLARLFEQVRSTTDTQAFFVEFNGFQYSLDSVTTPGMAKSSDGVTWTPVSMASGPTLAIRGGTVWRNQLVVAANAATPFVLSAAEAWTTFTAPVGGTNVDMVGVGPDDKILAWVHGKGLYNSPDGTTWTKVWPAASDPDEATCDLLDGSTGAVLIVTSDSKGSSMHEYFTPEGAATTASVVTWMTEKDTFFYRVVQYAGAAYIGSKKGIGGGSATTGNGPLWRKERGQMPRIVQTIGDGIRGVVASQDFGIRALVADGENLWVGAPMRAPNFSGTVGIPGVYWYNVDNQGLENVSPEAAIDTAPGNVAGKVYSAAMINGEVIISTPTGIWKRSKTNYAIQGYLDSSIYDLKAPDHIKTWRFTELLMESATPTESCTLYYRVGTLTGSWLGGTVATASGAKKIPFPDDAPTLAQYKLNSRQIQLHLVLSRGADATLQPRVTSVAVDSAQIKTVGTN